MHPLGQKGVPECWNLSQILLLFLKVCDDRTTVVCLLQGEAGFPGVPGRNGQQVFYL